MALKTLEDALIDELHDLLSAEQQITKALPKLAKAAQDPELKAGFEEHLAQTEGHIERIKQAFEILGKRATAKTCEAAKGLIKEGEEVIEEEADPDVKDAFLIAAAQKVEHYEIASYGTVCVWAETLGLNDVAKLLKQTLAEEKETDEKLTLLAESRLNAEAINA
jgi:ferritin-like metal-binding protein YciE